MRISELKNKIDPGRIPSHIAIIMDGNGRWASRRKMNRIMGHREGVKAVRRVIEGCLEIGVRYLTLYAFSMENWKRPKEEVMALMDLLRDHIEREKERIKEKNIRFIPIGRLLDLPPDVQKSLELLAKETEGNSALTLILALSYSGRDEILSATKRICRDVKDGKIGIDNIDELFFSRCLYTSGIPDPDLLIRTSGEFRISNFLLWQLAYTEIYITKKLWPSFTKSDLYRAIIDYQGRERRFGLTSEQIGLLGGKEVIAP